ncbi:class I SAM-dependent methyltransferase [Glycomyces arizonensis]|uniref:class I SAM-dependent methyltransferase n=1 Tax=Glycomyces arizonensis TaxID=256035 RepID=UPI0003F66146|nr:class I SAM-dependent methyltransferase [Glycomyces arizonensis]
MDYEALKEDLRKTYDAKAEAREHMEDHLWKQHERARFAEHLREAGSSTLLEIGAGHGVSGRHFADEGYAVTCIDLSPEMIGYCRAKGLTAEVMDFNELAFGDASFDAVFGMNTLLHVPRAELPGILDEVRRVLAPGGLFYWGQYGGKDSEGVWPDDRYEPKRFFSLMTVETISAVAAERFEVLDVVAREPDYTELEYHGLVLRRN